MTEEAYRPGLEGIIAGETAISTVDGGLLYRGYSVEDLASRATFEEVAYLILNGELPVRQQLVTLREPRGFLFFHTGSCRVRAAERGR